MRVQVNVDTCQGIGLCEMHAPTVLAVPEGGCAMVILTEVPADRQAEVRRAIADCPTDSLSLIE